MQAGKKSREAGLRERGREAWQKQRQITIRHYKVYTCMYNTPHLVLKCQEGRRTKDAGRQASERGGGRPGKDREAYYN